MIYLWFPLYPGCYCPCPGSLPFVAPHPLHTPCRVVTLLYAVALPTFFKHHTTFMHCRSLLFCRCYCICCCSPLVLRSCVVTCCYVRVYACRAVRLLPYPFGCLRLLLVCYLTLLPTHGSVVIIGYFPPGSLPLFLPFYTGLKVPHFVSSWLSLQRARLPCVWFPFGCALLCTLRYPTLPSSCLTCVSFCTHAFHCRLPCLTFGLVRSYYICLYLVPTFTVPYGSRCCCAALYTAPITFTLRCGFVDFVARLVIRWFGLPRVTPFAFAPPHYVCLPCTFIYYYYCAFGWLRFGLLTLCALPYPGCVVLLLLLRLTVTIPHFVVGWIITLPCYRCLILLLHCRCSFTPLPYVIPHLIPLTLLLLLPCVADCYLVCTRFYVDCPLCCDCTPFCLCPLRLLLLLYVGY